VDSDDVVDDGIGGKLWIMGVAWRGGKREEVAGTRCDEESKRWYSWSAAGGGGMVGADVDVGWVWLGADGEESKSRVEGCVGRASDQREMV
jgi:hypothetical protein